MVLWWLLAIAFLLFALQYRENFVDPDRKIDRPALTPDGKIPRLWQTKIDAFSKIDTGAASDDMVYFLALQSFYDKVYAPAQNRPTDKDVEAFLKTADATIAGLDAIVLRRMIASSFTLELTESAAAREQKELATTGALVGFAGSNLEPGNARDEVYNRTENIYIPADHRKGDLPEGLYAPTEQTTPFGRGESKTRSTSWNSVLPYSVCPCAENVL